MGGGESLALELIICLIFGFITAAIASAKGRNAIGYFFVGFFFSCFGLILILCLSNLNEEKARIQAQEIQNRRLKEQLRQEQMKLEALRQHATARLDRHDEALRMNSRSLGGDFADTDAIAPSPPPNPNQLPAEETNLVEWYYVLAGRPTGPVRRSDLLQELSRGYITNKTLVWNPTMKKWLELGQVPELIGRGEQGETSA